jgi:hypothetical protein
LPRYLALGAKYLSRIADHRWFERRLVLADGGELSQEVRVDVRVGEEAGPGEELPGPLTLPRSSQYRSGRPLVTCAGRPPPRLVALAN